MGEIVKNYLFIGKSCMSNKMNIDELKSMIAGEIRQIGLNDVLDSTAVEKIKNKVMDIYNKEQAQKNVPEFIPEAAFPANLGNTEIGMMPPTPEVGSSTTGNTTTTGISSVEKPSSSYDSTQQAGQNIDVGVTGNIPAYTPYTPELPSFIEKIAPAKVIVFSQNELSEGGENLSNKPLRTFEDPDVKKSMNDFWLNKGQKKAEVYIAKLEKIGELEFNYTNGTTQFVEKRFEPDFDVQAKYKENPYMAINAGPATPGALDINGQPNIAAQIATSVDLEKVVKDIVIGILRDQLLTNNTKAINDVSVIQKPVGEFAGNFDTKHVNEISPDEPMGYSTTQIVKPMEESFSIKMIDLVNDYNKIDSPIELKEAIEKNDRKFLVKENSEVQEWSINGSYYYTPVVKMSIKKCYIK